MMLRARRVRYRRLARLRYQRSFLSFLDEQADRLLETVAEVFQRMRDGASAEDIRALPDGVAP